jgi:hypothetical protein
VTCGSALPATGPSPSCSSLKSDVAASTAKLQEDTKNYKYWPVVSIGVSYHF